jgi:CRP-like cAMP-binding protein
MENQNRERSLLFESFREDFPHSSNKKQHQRPSKKSRSDLPLPASEKVVNQKGPFEFLADFGLESILPYLEIRHAPADEVIWRQGDPCDFIVFVERGKVKITKRAEFEENHVVIGVVSGGSLAGDFNLLENNPFPTTATAMEHSLLGILSREKFKKILDDSPELGIQLLKGMLNCTSLQLRQSMNRLVHLF